MEKEIIRELREYKNFLTYRKISLIDKAEHELISTIQSKIMLSQFFNFFKQCKMLIRCTLPKHVPNNKGKILFLVYTHSHVNTLAPVLKKMKDSFLVVKRDGFTDNVAKKLKQNNIIYNDIEGYLTKELLKNIRKARKSFKAKYRELLKTKKFDKKKLKYLFLIYFPEMIRYIEIINNLLSVERPKLLVVMNERATLGNIAVHIAKQKRIKTLCIQHGVIGDASNIVPVSVDKIAVWGDSSKEALINKGVPKEKIIITGAPQFDNLAIKKAYFERKAIKELGINQNKKLVILTTQLVSDMEDITSAVFKAVKSIPGIQLVIKTHPAEYSIKRYKRIAKKESLNIIITKKHLYPLLSMCDVLITPSSTTGLEAMIMGKPLITINLSGKPDEMPYAESGAAIGVYRPEDIGPAIKSVLEDKDARKRLAKKAKLFIYDQCYKMDGNASKRVINLINSMEI